MNNKQLNAYTLYYNPKDFPGQYVARRFVFDKPTLEHFADADIETVRRWIVDRLLSIGQGSPFKIARDDNDDSVILETWI